ncbi:hypothetical protein [Pseudonocardia pini]|uniref:hypothetical protein n=1 Tax=Pseudonocardia pini TaxID=2758030 RepID=UPI0015F056C8|nr:hypothetical protein [Pseudonocardia pini]
MADDPEGGSATALGGLERAVQLVSAVVAPVTLVTALLFWFGWTRTNAVFREFGIEASVLGLSVQDYLVRSVEGLYVPVGIALLLTVVGLGVHGAVGRLVADPEAAPSLRTLSLDVGLTGAVLFGIGVLGIVSPNAFGAWTLLAPCSLAAGTVLLSWSVSLWRRLDGRGMRRGSWPALMTRVSTVLFVVLALFWAASEYAAAVGRGVADGIARDTRSRPGVVLFSERRLFLTGVQEDVLPPDPGDAYRFRYAGLRLLIESGGRLVLVPDGWTRRSGSAIILAGDGIRVEFTPAGR